MRKVKELISVAALYNDPAWQDARINVWDWKMQRNMRMTFAGSRRPSEDDPGEVDFIVEHTDDYSSNGVEEAFEQVISRIKEKGVESETMECWKLYFLKLILAKRKSK